MLFVSSSDPARSLLSSCLLRLSFISPWQHPLLLFLPSCSYRSEMSAKTSAVTRHSCPPANPLICLSCVDTHSLLNIHVTKSFGPVSNQTLHWRPRADQERSVMEFRCWWKSREAKAETVMKCGCWASDAVIRGQNTFVLHSTKFCICKRGLHVARGESKCEKPTHTHSLQKISIWSNNFCLKGVLKSLFYLGRGQNLKNIDVWYIYIYMKTIWTFCQQWKCSRTDYLETLEDNAGCWSGINLQKIFELTFIGKQVGIVNCYSKESHCFGIFFQLLWENKAFQISYRSKQDCEKETLTSAHGIRQILTHNIVFIAQTHTSQHLLFYKLESTHTHTRNDNSVNSLLLLSHLSGMKPRKLLQ